MFDEEMDMYDSTHDDNEPCPTCGKEDQFGQVCLLCEQLAAAMECDVCGAASSLSCHCV